MYERSCFVQKIKFGAILFVLLFITTGCSEILKGQYITVQKVLDEDNYEDFNKITNKKQVRKVRELLDDADWKVLKDEMEGAADYQFQLPFKNSGQDKIMSYYLWISTNGDTVEITTDSRDYVHLSEGDSLTLLEILINDK